MIIGIGIDILEKKRIQKLFLKYGDRFIKKIVNIYEVRFILKKKDKIEFLCKTFSIKEAISKSLSIGFRHGLSFSRIRLYNNSLGKPFIFDYNCFRLVITISHEVNFVVTTVIIIKY